MKTKYKKLEQNQRFKMILTDKLQKHHNFQWEVSENMNI